MRTRQASELLGRTPLLAGLPSEDLEELAVGAAVRACRKGEFVFHQGDPATSLFVIVQGAVKVFVTSEDGRQMVLAVLHSPDAFGEIAVLDGAARSASVQAVGPTVLLSVSRQALMDAIGRRPALADVLLRSLASLVRRTSEQAADLVFLDLPGRVAKLLVGLAERNGGTLDLAVTQTDLAAMAGGSRQSVNAILHDFQRRGFLELGHKTIVLGDLAALQYRAGLD